MKIEIDRKPLLAALAAVGPVADGKVKPALGGVRLEAADGRLTLACTDCEVWATRTVPADVLTPGVALVGVGQLLAVVKEIEADARVMLDADPATVSASWGPDDKIDLHALDADQFPAPVTAGGYGFDVQAADLARMIPRAAAGHADHETGGQRFTLSGFLLSPDPHKGQVRLVTTDTKRLAVAYAPATGFPEGEKPADGILPAGAVKSLRLLAAGGSVRVTVGPGAAAFAGDGWTLATVLVAGRYPPWSELFARAGKAARKSAVTVPAAALLAKVKQATTVMEVKDDKKEGLTTGHRLDMEWTAAAVGMRLRSEKGGAAVRLPLDGWRGPDVTTAFDPTTITDFLKAAEGDVRCEFAGGAEPMLMSCGDDYRFLAMPLSLEGV